jgi:hypothetical protein
MDRTKVIGEKPNYISPGGASEIRELIQRPQGELTHATCPSGRISHPAALDGLYEMFFVLAGVILMGDWCGVRREVA